MYSLFLLFAIALFCSCASQTPTSSFYQVYPTTAAGSAFTQKPTSYIVEEGDSLKKISEKFNVTIEELMERNHMKNSYNLKAGQVLFVPAIGRLKGAVSFSWPMQGRVVSLFGEDVASVKNKGLRIKAVAQKYVKAAAEGIVVFADHLKGWGQTIILKHPANFYTVYANLAYAKAKEGIKVKKGQVVAELASGERRNNDVLYFEIRRGYLPVDPLKYLR